MLRKCGLQLWPEPCSPISKMRKQGVGFRGTCSHFLAPQWMSAMVFSCGMSSLQQQQTWAYVLASLCTSSVSLGRLCHLPDHQVPTPTERQCNVGSRRAQNLGSNHRLATY